MTFIHSTGNGFGRRRRASLAALGLGVAAATILAGCDSTGTGTGGGGGDSGVAWGASAAEYQAALADMEPVTLIMQSNVASAETPDSLATRQFMAFLDEYSGGKITIDITWAYGIVSNVLDFDDALVDGRVDISSFWPQYDPAEYPATNLLVDAMVVRDPRMYVGFYSSMAAFQEVALGTPEIMAEWTDKGITPLVAMSSDGPPILVCTDPIESLADLQGRQIRAGGPVHSRELEELGAIPVSLPYPEVYEALQRGILDCSQSAHTVATSRGHIEVAPYVYHTDTESMASTPTNLYAGPRMLELPKAAQQLIQEAATVYSGYAFDRFFERVITETLPIATEGGGGFFALPQEVDDKLVEINDGILADVAATDLLDGEEFVTRLTEVNDKWVAKVIELGYEDDGPISAFPTWYTTTPDHEPWRLALVQDTLATMSPVNSR